MSYCFVPDLLKEITLPPKGTLSQTVYADDTVKVVLFGFAAGEELSEHTASMPASIQILSGLATISLQTTTYEACPGTWVHMQPRIPHSIKAKTAVYMLLTLFKAGKTNE